MCLAWTNTERPKSKQYHGEELPQQLTHPAPRMSKQQRNRAPMTELAVLAMAVNGTCTNCHWESGVFCSSQVLKRAPWWVGKGKTTYNDITPRKFGSSWCSLCPNKSEHQFFNLQSLYIIAFLQSVSHDVLLINIQLFLSLCQSLTGYIRSAVHHQDFQIRQPVKWTRWNNLAHQKNPDQLANFLVV